MVICEKCNQKFPFPWKLRRHLARKNPCIITANSSSPTANSSSTTANSSSPTANSSSTTANSSSPTNSLEKKSSGYSCKYCNKEFKRKYYKTRHEDTCKYNDEIWELENKCNLPHRCHPRNLCECKYCNTAFSRSDNLSRHLESCEKKEEYREFLESNVKQTQPCVSKIVNNTTNNIQKANTINNNTINIQVLGQESLEHVTVRKIKSILKKILECKYPGDNNLYKLSAETVADVHKLIREEESNRNIVIPHERRQIALVKRDSESGFRKEDMASVLDDGFRNTSRKLFDVMKNLEAAKKAMKIHKCVESFSKKGFRGHPEMPKNSGKYIHRREDVNSARRKFKLANMYEGNNDQQVQLQSESESESESEITHNVIDVPLIVEEGIKDDWDI